MAKYDPGQQTGTDANNNSIGVKISSPVIDFEDVIPAGATVKMATQWPEWIDTTGYAAIAFEFTTTQPINYGIEFRSDPKKPSIRPIINNTVNDIMIPRPGGINTRRRWVQFSITNNGTQDATVCFVAQLSTSPIQSSFEPLNAMVANTRLVPIQKIGGIQLKDSAGNFEEVLRDGIGFPTTEQKPLDISKLAKGADIQLIVDALAKTLKVNTVDISALAKDTSITALNTILQLLGKDTNLVAIVNAIGVTNNKDFATQATLSQVFTVIQAVRDKLSADPATATNQTGQSTLLSNILTKLSADPAKDASLQSLITAVQLLGKDTTLQSIVTALGVTNAKDFATQTTLAAVLAKISSDPSTGTNQNTANTTLSSILTKLADPATQTTLNLLYQLFLSGNAITKVTGTFWQQTQPVSLVAADLGIQAFITALTNGTAKFILPNGAAAGYAEDSAAVDGETLTMAGVVRKDSAGTLVSTDGDRTELQVNANGGLRVDGSAVQQPVTNPSLGTTVDAAATDTTGTWSLNALARLIVNTLKATQYAEDTIAVSGESLTMAGAVRKDTPGSLVDADGDRTELQTDEIGGLRVNINRSKTPTQTTVTATTAGVQALAANPLRRNVVITNTTSTSVTIHYGTGTTARISTINSINGYWEMAPDLFTGIITVKSSTGTPLLEVVETV